MRNAAAQARLAVLHIASGNTPLFMTTLSLDILHPRTVEYSKSVMQLVAFLIRKVSSSGMSLMTNYCFFSFLTRLMCVKTETVGFVP